MASRDKIKEALGSIGAMQLLDNFIEQEVYDHHLATISFDDLKELIPLIGNRTSFRSHFIGMAHAQNMYNSNTYQSPKRRKTLPPQHEEKTPDTNKNQSNVFNNNGGSTINYNNGGNFTNSGDINPSYNHYLTHIETTYKKQRLLFLKVKLLYEVRMNAQISTPRILLKVAKESSLNDITLSFCPWLRSDKGKLERKINVIMGSYETKRKQIARILRVKEEDVNMDEILNECLDGKGNFVHAKIVMCLVVIFSNMEVACRESLLQQFLIQMSGETIDGSTDFNFNFTDLEKVYNDGELRKSLDKFDESCSTLTRWFKLPMQFNLYNKYQKQTITRNMNKNLSNNNHGQKNVVSVSGDKRRHCDICNVKVPMGNSNWQQHIMGKRHKRNLKFLQ